MAKSIGLFEESKNSAQVPQTDDQKKGRLIF
jgi:hypothetical protein